VNQRFERNLLSSSFYHGLIERYSILSEKCKRRTFCNLVYYFN